MKGLLGFVLILFANVAFADDAGISGADTAWIMTATALVLFMTIPGLSLFYGVSAQQECTQCTDAVFCHHLLDVDSVDVRRLFTGIWRRRGCECVHRRIG